jgi:hypothetical protein
VNRILASCTAGGLLAAALGASGPVLAAPAASAPNWFIRPMDETCRTDIELVGRSGAIVPATLLSDGERVVLQFAKEDVPERAFLPIRVDQKPYSNLVLRTEPAGTGELVLSEAAQAAMRKGASLQIAWLSNEPVSAALAGSEQGLPDLRTCGAQVAVQHRQRLAAEQDARATAEASARAQALAEAQLEAARAQQAAADAERQRLANEEADRRWAEQQAERERAYRQAEQDRAEQERAEQLAERQRAYGYLPRGYRPPDNGYGDGYWEPRPAPPVWGYRPY